MCKKTPPGSAAPQRRVKSSRASEFAQRGSFSAPGVPQPQTCEPLRKWFWTPAPRCFPGVTAGNAVHMASSSSAFILTSKVLLHLPKRTAFAVSETVLYAVFPRPRRLRKVTTRQTKLMWPVVPEAKMWRGMSLKREF